MALVLLDSIYSPDYVLSMEKENFTLKEDVLFLTDRLLNRSDTLFKLGVELADTKRELEKYKQAFREYRKLN